MWPLIRLEVKRAFRSRAFLAALAVGMALAIACGIEGYLRYNEFVAATGMRQGIYLNQYAHCLWTLWLPNTVSISLPNVFFFVAPLLVSLAWAWSDVADRRGGWAAGVAVRSTRGAALASKGLAAFLAGGTVVALPLLVNLAVLACLVPAWTPDVNDCQQTGIWERCFASEVFFTSPGLYAALRVGLDFALAGAWSCLVLALSRLVRSRVIAIGLPYVALVFAKFASDRLVVLNQGRWGGFTILDQLKMRGDAFYYTGWAVLIDLAVMAAIAAAVALATRERDGL